MPLDRRRATDALLLVVSLVAVSTSAPLVREAAAPSLTIAFWRTALGAAATAPFARRQRTELTTKERRLTAVAGIVLAAHFATWISSLVVHERGLGGDVGVDATGVGGVVLAAPGSPSRVAGHHGRDGRRGCRGRSRPVDLEPGVVRRRAGAGRRRARGPVRDARRRGEEVVADCRVHSALLRVRGDRVAGRGAHRTRRRCSAQRRRGVGSSRSRSVRSSWGTR